MVTKHVPRTLPDSLHQVVLHLFGVIIMVRGVKSRIITLFSYIYTTCIISYYSLDTIKKVCFSSVLKEKRTQFIGQWR